jgi:transposase
MRRYALRDDQWERIRDLLPGREGHVGVTARDNRLFVEAVLSATGQGFLGETYRNASETHQDSYTIFSLVHERRMAEGIRDTGSRCGQ